MSISLIGTKALVTVFWQMAIYQLFLSHGKKSIVYTADEAAQIDISLAEREIRNLFNISPTFRVIALKKTNGDQEFISLKDAIQGGYHYQEFRLILKMIEDNAQSEEEVKASKCYDLTIKKTTPAFNQIFTIREDSANAYSPNYQVLDPPLGTILISKVLEEITSWSEVLGIMRASKNSKKCIFVLAKQDEYLPENTMKEIEPFLDDLVYFVDSYGEVKNTFFLEPPLVVVYSNGSRIAELNVNEEVGNKLIFIFNDLEDQALQTQEVNLKIENIGDSKENTGVLQFLRKEYSECHLGKEELLKLLFLLSLFPKEFSLSLREFKNDVFEVINKLRDKINMKLDSSKIGTIMNEYMILLKKFPGLKDPLKHFKQILKKNTSDSLFISLVEYVNDVLEISDLMCTSVGNTSTSSSNNSLPCEKVASPLSTKFSYLAKGVIEMIEGQEDDSPDKILYYRISNSAVKVEELSKKIIRRKLRNLFEEHELESIISNPHYFEEFGRDGDFRRLQTFLLQEYNKPKPDRRPKTPKYFIKTLSEENVTTHNAKIVPGQLPNTTKASQNRFDSGKHNLSGKSQWHHSEDFRFVLSKKLSVSSKHPSYDSITLGQSIGSLDRPASGNKKVQVTVYQESNFKLLESIVSKMNAIDDLKLTTQEIHNLFDHLENDLYEILECISLYRFTKSFENAAKKLQFLSRLSVSDYTVVTRSDRIKRERYSNFKALMNYLQQSNYIQDSEYNIALNMYTMSENNIFRAANECLLINGKFDIYERKP